LAAPSRDAPSSTAAIASSRRCLRRILCPLGKLADLTCRKVRPHRNRLAHGKRPSVCHFADDL
jgi:hypothetical protein